MFPTRRTAPALCAVALVCLCVLSAWGDQASTGHGLVRWTTRSADGARLSPAATAPPCEVAVLRLPHDQQQWGGVWHGAATGYFQVENPGRTSCALPRPSRVVAATGSGQRQVFDVDSLPTQPVVLAPGDRLQVQVSSPYDCDKPLTRSTAFALTFPTGTLRVPHARMAVQCGGALVDFSARGSDPSNASTTSTTPMSHLRATMSRVPRSAAPGEALTYAITLTNPTSRAIGFNRCPSYQEDLKGQPSSIRTYRLNCEAVGRIGAHSSVRFAMQLPLSPRVTRGIAVLDWKLQLASGSVSQGQFASAHTRIE